jgi:hypothetical protein
MNIEEEIKWFEAHKVNYDGRVTALVHSLEADRNNLKKVLRDACEKLHLYAHRQGVRRAVTNHKGEFVGSRVNPNVGQHYPAVQSVLARWYRQKSSLESRTTE